MRYFWLLSFKAAISVGNKISISKYSSLIRELPYMDQAFETKKATWQKRYNDHSQFKAFLKKTFITDSLVLSRGDLFNLVTGDFYSAVFSIIFWGYPRNMRGNLFKTILESLPEIEKSLVIEKTLTDESFKQISLNLKGKGMGLSTLTKLLYFFQFNIDGHRCLILDSRIIDVFNNGSFKELNMKEPITEFNKVAKYIEYLQIMERIAVRHGYSIDQLEFFLFTFGRNLKFSISWSKN